MKISELKEIKTIRRPTQVFDESGNRIYERKDFEFKVSSSIKEKGVERFFAKLIDITPYFLILYFLLNIHWFKALLISVLLVIVTGAVFEALLGTTLGKYLFKLKVLDDDGKKPSFFKSLKRNALGLLNLFPGHSDFTDDSYGLYGTRVVFSMHLNNKWSQTYVVNNFELQKIKELLLNTQ